MGWEEVDEGWGRLARDFAYLMEPSWWPEFEQVLRDTGVGEGTRYLDVCCGSGLAAQMAGRRGAVVHGLDDVEEALRRDFTPLWDEVVGLRIGIVVEYLVATRPA